MLKIAFVLNCLDEEYETIEDLLKSKPIRKRGVNKKMLRYLLAPETFVQPAGEVSCKMVFDQLGKKVLEIEISLRNF